MTFTYTLPKTHFYPTVKWNHLWIQQNKKLETYEILRSISIEKSNSQKLKKRRRKKENLSSLGLSCTWCGPGYAETVGKNGSSRGLQRARPQPPTAHRCPSTRRHSSGTTDGVRLRCQATYCLSERERDGPRKVRRKTGVHEPTALVH